MKLLTQGILLSAITATLVGCETPSKGLDRDTSTSTSPTARLVASISSPTEHSIIFETCLERRWTQVAAFEPTSKFSQLPQFVETQIPASRLTKLRVRTSSASPRPPYSGAESRFSCSTLVVFNAIANSTYRANFHHTWKNGEKNCTVVLKQVIQSSQDEREYEVPLIFDPGC